MLKNLLLALAWIFIFIGVLMVFCFLIIAHNDGYQLGFSKLDYNFTPKFFTMIGSVIGPLISASGFFFLYLNFREQQNTRHIDKLESKFYQLVKFHRDNVNEMTYSYFEKKKNGQNQNDLEKITAEKKKVFKVIHSQFETLYHEVDLFFQYKIESDIYEDGYLKKLKENKTLVERNINLNDYAKLDILYLIIFFGVGEDGVNTIKQISRGKYQEEFINLILVYTSFKPKRESIYWAEWLSIFRDNEAFGKIGTLHTILHERKTFSFNGERPKSITSDYQKMLICAPHSFEKYYGGHQFRLGHYFRNLFQAVVCIHNDKILTYKEKKEYTKVLKAQLSTFELIIFFISSVSQLGRAWELERKIHPEQAIDLDYQLITPYNFIRNLPNRELIDGITYSSFYPLVSYETYNDNDAREKRKTLEVRL